VYTLIIQTMSLFFKEDYEKLDYKLTELEKEFKGLSHHLFDYHVTKAWETIFELMNEIQGDFKTVRYPKIQSREEAWQSFFSLRQDIYTKKNERYEEISKSHSDTLFNMLRGLEYWQLREGLRQMLFTELKEIKTEVIENGKKLNEVGQHFSSIKHEMTKDHKSEVFNRIKEIRESHDEFWGIYKDRSQELYEAKEDRKRDFEDRKDKAKESIINNIKNNVEKLEKAEVALRKQEMHKEDLEDQIASAYSTKFREIREEWLSECNNKISDIESHIARLKSWIEDGENRLRNWD